MRYALLSDVHANLPALEAVLQDLARRPNVDAFNNVLIELGDADIRVEFVRVPYDLERTTWKILESGPPDAFADHLRRGGVVQR